MKKYNQLEYCALTLPQRRLVKTLYDFDFVCSLLVMVLAAILVQANFRVALIPSSSMYPTLAVGEIVFCKTIDDPSTLERDSIIIFEYHYLNGYTEPWCKRLIGKPGDVVMVTEYGVYRNGEFLPEPYRPAGRIDLTLSEPITLGENEYFVMGDNRNDSTDSRSIGPISGDDITAYALGHIQLYEDEALTNFQNSFLPSERNPYYTGS